MKKSALVCLSMLMICNHIKTSSSSENALDELLRSKRAEERKTAFLEIISNPDVYSDQILLGIEMWKKTRERGIDALNKFIYLAAFFKRDVYVEPLMNIANDPDYDENECIYDCPAKFALAVYVAAKRWTLPLTIDLNLMSDNRISLERSSPGITFARSEDQELLRKTETLSEEELIFQAAPFKQDYLTRWLAAEVLSHTVADDKNLIDLYWLALEEIVDASCQYRCAIYRAILRAETAKVMKGR